MKIMKIAIGSDRRGFESKTKLIKVIQDMGYDAVDVGPYDDLLPVDYPIYGEKVGKLVSTGECRFGVVICATGIGIMIAANKVDGIRCGMAYTDTVAKLMREHNDANVIAFGQDHMLFEDMKKRLSVFLNTAFLGGYHCTRIHQLECLEQGIEIKQTPIMNPTFK